MTADKFARLYDLGDAVLADIQKAFSLGMSADDIAAQIQSWGKITDVPVKKLAQLLKLYQKHLKDSQPQPTVEVISDQPVDPVAELTRLALIQRKRVDMALTKEAELKMPMAATDKTIAEMQETLLALQKAQIEQEKARRALDPGAVAARVKQALQISDELTGGDE